MKTSSAPTQSHPEPDLPKLQPGQRVELTITTIAFGGDGIGRIDNFVVFVPFVIEGEKVEVQIVDVKRRYATADLVRVIQSSPLRVKPKCPYYAQCAGCQYQHIDYTHQLQVKQNQIIEIFQRIGKMAVPPVDPVVPSAQPYGYRNKLVVHGPGKPGFWTMHGRSILPIESCPIARDEVNEKLRELSQQELENVHITIRCNSEGEAWTFTEPAPDEMITETVLNRTLQAPLGSFFQINQDVIAKAIEHVRDIFIASGCKILVDAYCGIGLFALMLADHAEHCFGIEANVKGIQAANKNAKAFGLSNYDFYPGKTERLLFYTQRQCNLDETCLILDPPRSGCGRAVLKTLSKQKPKKIIYVSCAPAMLARDLKQLVTFGYELDRVTPFDMFPQTQHCEAVAELTLQS